MDILVAEVASRRGHSGVDVLLVDVSPLRGILICRMFFVRCRQRSCELLVMLAMLAPRRSMPGPSSLSASRVDICLVQWRFRSPFVVRLLGLKVFEFFNAKVTEANSYQTGEVFTVSQELLSVLDGEFVVSMVHVLTRTMDEGGRKERREHAWGTSSYEADDHLLTT